MSVVSASFWHVTGTVYSPPSGPAYGPPPGPVSPYIHTYEDQHDQQKDAEHKHPIAREDDVMRAQTIRDTSHRHLPLPGSCPWWIHNATIRLEHRAFYLLEPAAWVGPTDEVEGYWADRASRIAFAVVVES